MELNVELIEWQKEVWADNSRFKVVAAGRRCGKSRLAAWLLIVNALQTKSGHVFYVAPTQGQARDIMWSTLLELGQEVITGSHVNNLQIKLVNGATISLKGADKPETMRGVSLKYLVMDEYADMKPHVWEQILRPALSDQKGSALFIGTPMGRNHFYELYKQAESGVDPNLKAWHFTTYDNPIIDNEEIEAAKAIMSSFAFRQEFMASFEARGSEMFKEEWIQYAKDEDGKGGKGAGGSIFIACDLAGFEQDGRRNKTKRLDDTCIAVVRVGQNGWHVLDMISGRWTLNETAAKIFQTVDKYSATRVGIEKGIAKQAVSSPLNDLMKRTGKFFRIEELTHGNQNKTDRIMWALQGRFENGWITLEKADWNMKFLDQLFQFPDVLTHDDMVDALAYIDQLSQNMAYSFDVQEYNDWEALDEVAGY